MSKSMTDQELRALVAEVQGSLTGFLTTEAEKLSKAHPGEETSSELPPDESASADSAPDSGPPADSGPPDASASPEGPPPDASADGGPPPPDASGPPDAGQGGDPMADPGVLDPAAIEAELAQMPPEHVKALYLACKSVIFASMGGGDASAPPPGPDASAPPMGPPGGGGSPPMSPGAPPAMKAEVKANPANGGQIKGVSKSESDKDAVIADLQKKVAEFDGITSALMNVVEKVISVPARKAVVGVSELQKSGDDVSKLNKDEIKARLDRAARTKLNKSDRELINQYSVGTIDASGIKHLLSVK